MAFYVMPLSCGCNAERHCNSHSEQQWRDWLEGIAESYYEDRGW